MHNFRFRVVQTFLASGTPLSRLPYFKPLLERSDVSLNDPSDLGSLYIPLIEKREFELLKGELKAQFLGISFDGTSRLGEALNIVGRYCSDDFVLNKRLLRFKTTKLHMNAAQLAQLITQTLCSELGVAPQFVVSISRDSVSVNGAACRLLTQGILASAEDIMCMSHTLNNVGARISLDTLRAFMTPWLELVGGRNPHRGAQSLWRQLVSPMKVPGYSNTRWYSVAEIQFVLAENFDRLVPFVDALEQRNIGDATTAKLRAILGDSNLLRALKFQLAAMLDMRDLVKITYELEGDRLEILLLYERVETLRAKFRRMRDGDDGMFPNLDAALRNSMTLSNGTPMAKVRARMF